VTVIRIGSAIRCELVMLDARERLEKIGDILSAGNISNAKLALMDVVLQPNVHV
jgi:hypothetical protein